MATNKKIVGSTLALLSVGYVIGLLRAPRSGRATRKLLKKKTNKSVVELEKQLKAMFKQTEGIIKELSGDKGLNSKLKQSKQVLIKNQAKIKDLLSNIHNNDAMDEDLTEAFDDAKKSLKSFSNYLKK